MAAGLIGTEFSHPKVTLARPGKRSLGIMLTPFVTKKESGGSGGAATKDVVRFGEITLAYFYVRPRPWRTIQRVFNNAASFRERRQYSQELQLSPQPTQLDSSIAPSDRFFLFCFPWMYYSTEFGACAGCITKR